jgi:hypothetical protein
MDVTTKRLAQYTLLAALLCSSPSATAAEAAPTKIPVLSKMAKRIGTFLRLRRPPVAKAQSRADKATFRQLTNPRVKVATRVETMYEHPQKQAFKVITKTLLATAKHPAVNRFLARGGQIEIGRALINKDQIASGRFPYLEQLNLDYYGFAGVTAKVVNKEIGHSIARKLPRMDRDVAATNVVAQGLQVALKDPRVRKARAQNLELHATSAEDYVSVVVHGERLFLKPRTVFNGGMYSTYVQSPKALKRWAEVTGNNGPQYDDSSKRSTHIAESLPLSKFFSRLTVDQVANSLRASAIQALAKKDAR